MYITNSLIDDIVERLQQRGIKDTEFPVSDALDNNTQIALVQNGSNFTTSLESLSKYLLPFVKVEEGQLLVMDNLDSEGDSTNALSAGQGYILKQMIKNIENPGESEISFNAECTVGGIGEGEVISKQTLSSVLTKIFTPEYAPVWTDAKVDLKVDGKKEYIATIGNALYNKEFYSYTATSAFASAGSYIISGGAEVNTEFTTNSTIPMGTIVGTRSKIVLTATTTFNAGTAEVVTSQNNATNKTGEKNTLVSLATVNTNIDPSTNTIKSLTAQDSITLYYTYPIYVNGEQLPLAYDKEEYGEDESLIYQVTTTNPLEIKVPEVYTDFKLYYKDEATDAWVQLIPSPMTQTLSIADINVTYTSYNYKEVSGSRPYKFTFKINA